MNEDILKEEIAILESNNRAMQEEMARTWEKYDKVINNWNELKECIEKVKLYVKEIDVIDKGELLLMLCEPEINKIEKEIESRKQ